MTQLSEIQEDVLWELSRYEVEATDPAWCAAADCFLDQGLVNEKDRHSSRRERDDASRHLIE